MKNDTFQKQLQNFQDQYRILQEYKFELKGVELGFKNRLTNAKIFTSSKQCLLTCNSFSQFSYLFYLDNNPPFFTQERILIEPQQKFTANFDIDLKFDKFEFAKQIIVACSDGKCRLFNIQNKNFENLEILKENLIKLNQFCLNNENILATAKQPSFFVHDLNKQKNIIENFQHSNTISTMSQHPQGSLVYFGEDSGYGIIWDMRIVEPILDFNTNFEEERKFYEIKNYEFTNMKYLHEEKINSSQFDKRGIILVTSSNDKTVKIWDIRKQKLIQTIPAHNEIIIQAEFLKNSNFLLTADIKGVIKIWDWFNLKIIKEFETHKKKVITTKLFNDDKSLAVIYLDKKVEIFEF